jgi:putative redox protein
MTEQHSPLPKGVVEVSETGTGTFTQLIRAGRHLLTADEPESAGGNDKGPGPYDLVLAGLGACTTMTVRMYADRKNIPLEKVSVRLSHQRIHADDCANCETKDGKLDVIERELILKGDLDDTVRQKLVEIAEKCPVSRTLTGTIEVHTTLADRAT